MLACQHKVESLLATKTLSVVPYGRGEGYPPDTLYHAWKAMADAKALDHVFYEMAIRDLEAFCEYMRNAVLFLVLTREAPQVVGLVWFTGVTPYKGSIGIWYRKELWGDYSRMLTSRVGTYVFHVFGWEAIWGFTPWRAAVQHGLKIGYKPVATLPQFVQVGAKLMDLHVVRLDNTVCRPRRTQKEGDRASDSREIRE